MFEKERERNVHCTKKIHCELFSPTISKKKVQKKKLMFKSFLKNSLLKQIKLVFKTVSSATLFSKKIEKEE